MVEFKNIERDLNERMSMADRKRYITSDRTRPPRRKTAVRGRSTSLNVHVDARYIMYRTFKPYCKFPAYDVDCWKTHP